MIRYNPAAIEPKWQEKWASDRRYAAPDKSDKPKYYVTGMFPYPSGAGMHTGHFFEHSIVDAVARFRRSLGYNVMYPMGWDSFGLPAENYAIKTGRPPTETTRENIANFKNQLRRVGSSIDWDREVNTADPEYYKWTQWVFTQLFERGLAYQKEANQWWCPVDKTVLANEQVEGGKCWRCGNDVVKKAMKQWFFKITDYADALLDEIPGLDWPDKIKTAQTNWIGRSKGAEVVFELDGHDDTVTVFTTRPDTLFGATFLVLAPEHPLVAQLTTDETRESVNAYVKEAIKKSEIERQSEGKEKTGVFTGSYAVNPVNGDKIPVWVADYVLWGYGTGAIMAVPAHDERDYAFAEKFGLSIKQVVANNFIDTQAPPREGDIVDREAVQLIVRHPNDDKYLLLKMNGWESDAYSLVTGGLEDDDVTTAALRELREETGFDDVDVVSELPNVCFATFYHEFKKVNRRVKMHTAVLRLKSLHSVDVGEEEKALNTPGWYTASEATEHIFGDMPRHIFENYIAGVGGAEHGDGVLINSGQFDGVDTAEARELIVQHLHREGKGEEKVTYKMRDWLISRQRYWGAPIPIIHCPEHGAVAVPEKDLPVLLPDVKDYAPRGDGKSVLAAQEEWVKAVCPTCGKPALRETDTMDGYACSSWYLLRYTDPHNSEQAWAPEKANYWSPVDMYIGGDHAVAHLLYVRFWSHVFYDMKLVPTKEPVKKLVYHGLIQAEDGRKMSKSLGNTIDPLEVIDAGYGADALRTFELFLGPINENSNWSSRGIAGVYRFLNRFWTLTQEYLESDKNSAASLKELQAITHATIKKVTDDVDRLDFNTAIAALMECVNELYKLKLNGFSSDWQFTIESLVKLIQPFAPHMTAELWEQLGHETQLDTESWPTYDESLLIQDTVTIVLQVNGKVRANIEAPTGVDKVELERLALENDRVKEFVGDKKPTRVIVVPGRLVNVVTA